MVPANKMVPSQNVWSAQVGISNCPPCRDPQLAHSPPYSAIPKAIPCSLLSWAGSKRGHPHTCTWRCFCTALRLCSNSPAGHISLQWFLTLPCCIFEHGGHSPAPIWGNMEHSAKAEVMLVCCHTWHFAMPTVLLFLCAFRDFIP